MPDTEVYTPAFAGPSNSILQLKV